MQQIDEKIVSPMVEALADYAHSAWVGWMDYLFDKSTFNSDGSVTIPKDLAERWMRQMSTYYVELPESEKESDRDEARKILVVFSS